MNQKKALRFFWIGIVFILLLTIVGLLTACEFEPILDERCYEDYENFSFYEIEQEGSLGTLKTSYRLTTPHGDIDVPDHVYEGAMEYEYMEVCYERADGVASTYTYTKKANDLRPEPEIITETVIETVTETVIEIETVYTHATLEDDSEIFSSETPVYFPYGDNIAWIVYNVTEGNREGITITDPEDPGQSILWELSNFLAGDTIIITIVYEPHTIADDEIWLAQITHYRYGITINTLSYPEEYEAIGNTKLEDYIPTFIEEFTLVSVHDILYPEVIPNE